MDTNQHEQDKTTAVDNDATNNENAPSDLIDAHICST